MAGRAVSALAAVIGWDVGGAHLKAASVSASGELLQVWSLACPLWQGLDQLAAAVATVAQDVDLATCRHALTMTGEMCDLFSDRQGGVAAIAGWFAARVPGGQCRVYAVDQALLEPPALPAAKVASMNWHASASALAGVLPDALLIDMGSTTTDLIRIEQGQVVTAGIDDRHRLASDELVYQGVVRTPVMALAARVPYRGEWLGLAAEYFATTADVHRLCGSLPPTADLQPSADGRGKSLAESAARLARMVGDDASGHDDAVHALAMHLAAAQRRRLREAIQRVEQARRGRRAFIVGAGIGRFLIRQVADDAGWPYIDFAEALGLPAALRATASEHAPAVAMALLGARQWA